MAFQKKYYFQFIKIHTSEVHVVELYQNTDTIITAIEVKAADIPITFEMPELDSKFQVVRGSGCTINLISEDNMGLFNGLYHVDPQEFKVKYLVDNVLIWTGYLNSEMISESYDFDKNYQITITGNDGLALLDRFSFLQSNGSNYTGIKSKFEILLTVLQKVNAFYNDIRIYLSTTFADQTGDADSTLLHESYINCDNFYDEDDKPMTLREVLESILAPYGAFIKIDQNNIYICDINTMAKAGTITYKVFTYPFGVYSGTTAINNANTFSGVGFAGTGSNIEKSGGVNRQVVAYSPYPYKDVQPEILTSLTEFTTIPSTFSTKDGYQYRTLEGNSNMATQIGGVVPLSFEESYYQNPDNSNIYLRYGRISPPNQILAASLINQPYLSISAANSVNAYPKRYIVGCSIYITGEILAKTKNNPYDDTQTGWPVVELVQWYHVKIGDKYWDDANGVWTTTPTINMIQTRTANGDIIADVWTELGYKGAGIKVRVGNIDGELLYGTFDFGIYTKWEYLREGSDIYLTNSTTAIQEIWMRNLKVELINIDGTTISDSDVENIGILNSLFRDEGDKITLTCGTDSQFADKGKILRFDTPDYYPIKEWTREGQTYKIEELLLGSICSNERQGYLKLTGVKLKAVFSTMNVFSDSFISGHPLMINAIKIDPRNNSTECSFVEISEDILTIDKL